MFPGDPVSGAYWSEVNQDGEGTPIPAADMRYVVVTGPFRIEPGEAQEVVYANLWARGEDHLDSVTRLRAASDAVEAAYRTGFDIEVQQQPEPSGVSELLTPGDGAENQPAALTLRWSAVEHATYYVVQVAEDERFQQPVTVTVVPAEPDGTQYRLEGLEPGRDYYWRVWPGSLGGIGPGSRTGRFSTGTPAAPTEGRFSGFEVVHNAAGPVDPPESAGADFAGYPVAASPGPAQQATTDARWVVHTSSGNDFEDFQLYVRDFGSYNGRIFPFDWEWRFIGSSLCYGIGDPGYSFEVPFALWRTGVGTPDDPSDDVRMTCLLDEIGEGTLVGVFDIGGGTTLGTSSDAVDWILPADDTPGASGYEADAAAIREGTYDPDTWNGGAPALINMSVAKMSWAAFS
jgi:hypothetical protein